MLRRIIILVVLCLSMVPVVRAQEGDGDGILTHDGLERTYHVAVPSDYDGSEAVPLVVALHPYASSGKGMAAITGFDMVAEDQGFIVVYPDSVGLGWDDGRSAYQTTIEPADDVGFIMALVDELTATYNVIPNQVYMTGFANGGSMAYRLACQYPEQFGRVVVVGATVWEYHQDVCPQTSAPVSILMMVGEEDVYYPPIGRNLETSDLRILSVSESLAFWLDRNGCEYDAEVLVDEAGLQAFDACQGDSSVAFHSLRIVGHNWPRVGDYALNQFEFDASQVAAQFFLEGAESLEDVTAPSGFDLWSGMARSYSVYVPPSYDASQPMPLVMALHGRPHNGYGVAYLLDMNRVARDEGFIVVYPDGIEQGWNYVSGFEGYAPNDVDDVAFLSRLADDLALDLNIDPERLYVIGFSNGGFMTQRMACDAADQFAAFGVVGATIFPGFAELCADTRPVPIMFIHGTRDPSVPWAGIASGETLITTSVPDTLTFWVVHDDCQQEDTVTESIEPSGESAETSVTLFRFRGCTDDLEVLLYAVEGGGHTIPGVPRMDSERFGATNLDIDGPAVIWDYLSQYTLNGND